MVVVMVLVAVVVEIGGLPWRCMREWRRERKLWLATERCRGVCLDDGFHVGVCVCVWRDKKECEN